MRTPWGSIQENTSGTWTYLQIRVDFTPSCSRDGPTIACTALPPVEDCLPDELRFGPICTTQERRLHGKIIDKAVDIAYSWVFNTRREPNKRVSHVSWDKIPARLLTLLHNLFCWYGFEGVQPVYLLDVPMRDIRDTALQEYRAEFY
jgi:hypothetical protein